MSSGAVTLDFSKSIPIEMAQPSAQTQTSAPAKAQPGAQSSAQSNSQPSTQSAPVTLDFSQAQLHRVSMVGPQGQKQQVPVDDVPAMRQNNFAVEQQPGVKKAVDYNNGRVNYILPSEENTFHSAGHAVVQPDGSIRYPIIRDKNGVIFQDPLEEEKAHQRVYAALDAAEKSRNQRYELKEFGKAGLKASAAAGLAVAGAGPAAGAAEALIGPSLVPVAGGTGFGGAAATTAAGPSLAGQAASWAGRQLVQHYGKALLGSGALTAIITKVMHKW